jgi:hypothetical protein
VKTSGIDLLRNRVELVVVKAVTGGIRVFGEWYDWISSGS